MWRWSFEGGSWFRGPLGDGGAFSRNARKRVLTYMRNIYVYESVHKHHTWPDQEFFDSCTPSSNLYIWYALHQEICRVSGCLAHGVGVLVASVSHSRTPFLTPFFLSLPSTSLSPQTPPHLSVDASDFDSYTVAEIRGGTTRGGKQPSFPPKDKPGVFPLGFTGSNKPVDSSSSSSHPPGPPGGPALLKARASAALPVTEEPERLNPPPEPKVIDVASQSPELEPPSKSRGRICPSALLSPLIKLAQGIFS